MSACRGCNAEMLWGIHESNGKGVPLDPDPRADGNLVATGEVREGRIVVRYVRKGENPEGTRYVTHFATCPEAGSFRSKR